MLPAVEEKRLQLSKRTAAQKKSLLGQFLTPEKTATFMAGLFRDGKGVCRLLDAGAGIGSLSAAFLDRWIDGGFHFQRVELNAFELDTDLVGHLSQTLDKYNNRGEAGATGAMGGTVRSPRWRGCGGMGLGGRSRRYTRSGWCSGQGWREYPRGVERLREERHDTFKWKHDRQRNVEASAPSGHRTG